MPINSTLFHRATDSSRSRPLEARRSAGDCFIRVGDHFTHFAILGIRYGVTSLSLQPGSNSETLVVRRGIGWLRPLLGSEQISIQVSELPDSGPKATLVLGFESTCSPSLEILSSRFAIHQQIGSECLAESSPSSVIERTPQCFLFRVPSANAKLLQPQFDNGCAEA